MILFTFTTPRSLGFLLLEPRTDRELHQLPDPCRKRKLFLQRRCCPIEGCRPVLLCLPRRARARRKNTLCAFAVPSAVTQRMVDDVPSYPECQYSIGGTNGYVGE